LLGWAPQKGGGGLYRVEEFASWGREGRLGGSVPARP